ncbi:ABC transporter substrate-binding protein, partial [Caldivirga sp.]|uniref:ABC transporter substrate-binding protein n=1 Tax=Caldivirga sp. TaxID=2080243 RepID=UPI003D0B6211
MERIVNTPWPVWKNVVMELKTMNATQAFYFGEDNISKLVVPLWSLAPYYAKWSTSPTSITFVLEPEYFNGVPLLATWNKIIPFHTWQYYPQITAYRVSTSIGTTLAEALKLGNTWWPSWDPTPAYVSALNKSGYVTILIPDISILSFAVNVTYPWNIPQVRQALLYIINRTEAALAWTTLKYTIPVYINIPAPEPNVAPGFWLTFPPDIRQYDINFTQPNWTKAAELLESAGLYKKGNQWYLPNGTPLTLTVTMSGTGWWPTVTQEVTLQLTNFGIPTKMELVESGLWSQLWPCHMQARGDWNFAGANKGGINELWIYYDEAQWTAGALFMGGWCVSGTTVPFDYPIIQDNHITGWYCKPLTTNLPIPNNTITWCINSTFGYINLTNWETAISAAVPGSSTYYELVKAFYAWNLYWVPAVQISEINLGQTFPIKYVDPMWAYTCINYSNPKYTVTAYALLHNWAMGWGWDGFYPGFNTWLFMGAFAPPGVIPPLAQAIINGSLWTNPYFHKWAVLIGLPNPDPQLQACVASYFHTTYTPVTTTTSTTTTTTTSTTTTTAVATATTTVTSTTTAVST